MAHESGLTRRGLVVLVTACALVLGACGGGAQAPQGITGGSRIQVGLRVTTLDLPTGHVDETYPATRLEAEGPAGGALRWRLWDGELPLGVRLEEDGRLAGTPREAGFYVFTVHVTDSTLAGTGTLALAVDAFGLAVQAGLVVGDAWSGRPVALRTAGQEGPVQFALLSSESGASLADVDPAAGTATLWPGGRVDGLATDVVEAIDLDTGRRHQVSVPVCPDPTQTHTARFGSSDVWYVNDRHKVGDHAYATDLHAAYAWVGLRSPDSTDWIGTPSDRVAELWLRLEFLRYLNVLYLRESDGSAGAEGLAISFPFEEPGTGYVKPAQGQWLDGAPNHYSEIALIDGVLPGVVGTAYIDDEANTLHENDTSIPGEELGVFVDALSNYFRSAFGHRELQREPLGPDDLPALRALLHDLPSPGGRYDLIAQAGRDFAQALASVAAHEIAHSLGLEHSASGGAQSLMNPAAAITPWTKPTFRSEDRMRLGARLPGPGRQGGARRRAAPQAVEGTTVPAGGVGACPRPACQWRLPDAASRRGP